MFKIIVLLVAAYGQAGSTVLIERQVTSEGPTYATLLQCRSAMQHSNIVQGQLANAVQKLNKFADNFEQPSGFSLRGKRVVSVCIPSSVDPTTLATVGDLAR